MRHRILYMWLLSLLPYSYTGCTHKTLYGSAVNFINSISLGRKGLLASLFYVKDAEDCARQCANFQYCYVAEFQRRGNVGFCDLYHYHYPNIYNFEKNSSMRIVSEVQWPEAQVLYDIDCDTPVNKKSKKCQFSTYQNFPPRKSRGNFNEVSSDTPALTVEECARACAQVRRTCNAAIFVPTSFYSDDPLGTCKRYNSVAASVDKIVKMAEKNSPVLIGRVDCQVESSLCTYKTSPTVFGSVNDLDIPPDVYYLPRSISHCAQICGESVDCVEVEYEHKFNEYPRCLLFKTSQYPQALSTLHRPDSKEQKQRLTEITCNGKIKKIPLRDGHKPATKTPVRTTATPRNKPPVTQPAFPTAKHRGGSRSSNGRP